MLVYLGIFLLFAFACFVARDWRSEKIYLVFVLIFLTLFAGTRLEVGCDFHAYYLRFKSVSASDSLFEIFNREEPGYWVQAYLLKGLGLDYVWMNLTGAIFFFFCVGMFARRTPNMALFIALLFPIMVVQLGMSGYRQMIAVGFLMLALNSFMFQKRWRVILFILLGSLFHQSLVIFLPLALAVGREFSAWRVLVAFALLSPIALLLSAERIDVYSDRYVEEIYGEMESSGAVFRHGLLLLSAVVFELYRTQMRRLFPDQYSLLRLFSLLTFAITPLVFLSTVVIHRLGYYILPVQILTLSLLPYAIFPTLKSVNFGQIFPLGVYAAYIVVWFIFGTHGELCYIPYKSFLF
ncbi:MAG: EpsG family protein [Pseudomonadales bacterium]